MYKTFLGVLLLPALALAEPVKVDKTLICDDVMTVLSALSGSKYKEMPLWLGKSIDSQIVIMANKESGTFTIVQFNSTTACILGDGEGFKFNIDEMNNQGL